MEQIHTKIKSQVANFSTRELSMIINSRTYTEENDAALIAGIAVIYSIIANLFTSSGFEHLLMFSGIIIGLLALIFIFLIYIVKINYFTYGNSYVKRKYLSIGILYAWYCIVVPGLISNSQLLGLLLTFIPLVYHKTFINSLWHKYDSKHYHAIDQNNPYQTRSLFEKRNQAILAHYASSEFEARGLKHMQTMNSHQQTRTQTVRNLDDIEIKNREH